MYDTETCPVLQPIYIYMLAIVFDRHVRLYQEMSLNMLRFTTVNNDTLITLKCLTTGYTLYRAITYYAGIAYRLKYLEPDDQIVIKC